LGTRRNRKIAFLRGTRDKTHKLVKREIIRGISIEINGEIVYFCLNYL